MIDANLPTMTSAPRDAGGPLATRSGVSVAGRLARDSETLPGRDRSSAQQSFAVTLGKRMDMPPDTDPRSAARKAAEQLVSQTFVQPMLKLLRDSNNAAPPFAPGPAEKQFRSLMDVELAQRIVNSANFPLVDALARRLKSPQPTLEASA